MKRAPFAVVMLLVSCRREATRSESPVAVPSHETVAPKPNAKAAFRITERKDVDVIRVEDASAVASEDGAIARYALEENGARKELGRTGLKDGDEWITGMFATADADTVLSIAWDGSIARKPTVVSTRGGESKVIAKIEPAPHGLLFDTENLYVGRAGAVGSIYPGDGTILAFPRDAGAPRTLVSKREMLNDIALGSAHIYWTEFTDGRCEIRRVAKASGKDEKVAACKTSGTLVVSSSGEVFLVTDAVEKLEGAALKKVEGTDGAIALASDGAELFFLTSSEVRTPTKRVSAVEGKPRSIAVSKTHVVWATDAGLFAASRLDG